MSFDTLGVAVNFQRILEAHDHDLAAAESTRVAILRQAPTVSSAVELHMSERSGASERTMRDYQSRIDLHITPHLGAVPVDALTKAQVAEWLRLLTDESDLATRTVVELRAFLSAAVATAVAHGMRQDNPVAGMRVPRTNAHRKAVPRFLDRDEFQALVAATAPHYRPLIVFLAGTGLRWGEAAGLNVEHLRLGGKPSVAVRQALHTATDGTTFIGPVKAKASVRDVSLGEQVAAVLPMVLLGRAAGDAVFTGPRGVGRLYHGQFHNRVWTPAVEKSGLGKLRPHDLRHTHASWLIEQNVPLTFIQRRLGHESIKTTSDLYGHLSPAAAQVSADAITRAMDGAGLPD